MKTNAPGAPRKPKVSLGMIVKNEEDNLPACLASVADLVDEIVVVDTGSTDRTKEIAQRFGAKVYDFPWVDSFAAARNEALRHSTGEWSLRLDADDRLDEENRRRLRNLFAGLKDEIAGYAVKYIGVASAGSDATVINDVRLFRNHPSIRWKYRIHELIAPALKQAGANIYPTDMVIHTVGYQDAGILRRKQERNRRLLLMEDADHPNDPYMLFHLGWNYVSCGETAQGLPYLQRSLDLAKPDDTFVGLVYGQLARGYYQIGRRAESLAVSRQGQRWFPQYAELVFLESILLGELGDLQGSEACLRRLLDPTAGYVATDMGLCSYKARQNLAVIYSRQRRFSEAEAEWRRVLAEQPGYVPAWLSLADLWLSAGRISDLEQAVQSLQAQASTPGIADLLQARVCLTRKDFTAAKECLKRAASIAALTPWARRMLGEVTKQESGA